MKLTLFEINTLVNELASLGVKCKVGKMQTDVHHKKLPYFERWLSNRDGFVTLLNENIDYIGIEDIVRMGPFFNIYCLIENQHISENDDNAYKLLDARPFFDLNHGVITKLGWSGGVLADFLTKDTTLYNSFAKNIMKEEVRRISIKVANYACIIETRAWEAAGIVSIYEVLDRIGLNIKKLLQQIHLGNDIGT
jgi:hypothetical protein